MENVSEMIPFMQYFVTVLAWFGIWLQFGLTRLWRAFPVVNNWTASPGITERQSCQADSEEWKTNEALRRYDLGDESKTMVTIQTRTHAFHVSRKQSNSSNHAG